MRLDGWTKRYPIFAKLSHPNQGSYPYHHLHRYPYNEH